MNDKTNSAGCLLFSLIVGFLLIGLAAILRGRISWLAGWLILLFGWGAVGFSVEGFFATRKGESKCNEQSAQETVRVSGERQDAKHDESSYGHVHDDRTRDPVGASVLHNCRENPAERQKVGVNKYALAILACFGIFMVYVFIGVALGWRHGGGAFPMIILLGALGGTWKAITGKKPDEKKDNQ